MHTHTHIHSRAQTTVMIGMVQKNENEIVWFDEIHQHFRTMVYDLCEWNGMECNVFNAKGSL